MLATSFYGWKVSKFCNFLHQFKSLLYKYQHFFIYHIPHRPLLKVFLTTGGSPPVYRLPHRMSSAELAAIKTEIERMLKLEVIRSSHSA